jgi:uncharacterized membrane protein YozB (DUF420 family)
MSACILPALWAYSPQSLMIKTKTSGRDVHTTRVSFWILIFILAGIGVGAAVNRFHGVRNGHLLYNPILPYLSGKALQDLQKYDHTFFSHPLLTFFHIIPGSIFLILASLQFSSTIRTRHISYHRWSGRFLMLIGAISGIFGLILSIPFRFRGLIGTSAVLIFGTLFLVSLTNAFFSIKRGDVASHRRWMIRAFCIAIGISTIRIVSGVLLMIAGQPSFELLGLSFWIGWVFTSTIGELWIRHSEKNGGQTSIGFITEMR